MTSQPQTAARPQRPQASHQHWLIAGSAAVVLLGQGISFFTIGLYLDPVTTTHGFSKSEFSITMSLLSLFAAIASLVSPPVRALLGFKPTMILGCAMSAGALLCLSLATELYQFHLSAVLLGVGAGFCSLIPASTLVTNWFVSRRGLVMAAVLSATALGGTLFSPLITYLTVQYSYHVAFQASAIAIAFTVLPVIFFVREKPSDLGLLPYGASDEELRTNERKELSGVQFADARKRLSFYMLLLGNTGFIMSFGATLHYIPSLLADAGISPLAIGPLMSFTFISVAVGKIVMGLAHDRYGVGFCVGYASVLFLIAMILSGFVNQVWIAYVFALVFGLSMSLGTVPPPLLTSRIFGDKDYITIYSIVSGVAIVASAIATYGGGLMRDALGSYSLVFLTAAVVSIAALAAIAIALRFRPMPAGAQ